MQNSKVIKISTWNNLAHKQACVDVVPIENRGLFREEEACDMDDNKILENYLNKVDQDRRDMEQRLMEDRRESEKRITDERRLSEERMEDRFNKVMDSLEKTNSRLDASVEKIETKVEDKITILEDKYENLKWWILGTCLATILSVAAMIYSK